MYSRLQIIHAVAHAPRGINHFVLFLDTKYEYENTQTLHVYSNKYSKNVIVCD